MALRDCDSRVAIVVFPEPGAPDIWIRMLRGACVAVVVVLSFEDIFALKSGLSFHFCVDLFCVYL